MALSDAEQRELLTGIRELLKSKPGLRLPARSVNCRVKEDDEFGHTMSAEAEAADARVTAEKALATVNAIHSGLKAAGVIK